VAAVLLLAACGSDGSGGTGRASSPEPATTAATPSSPPTTMKPVNVVATAEVPSVQVFANPGDPEPVQSLENPKKPNNTPVVFLVREQQREWLHVFVPLRPNGSTGWIRESDVSLTTHDYRILIELGAHRLTVWEGEEVFAEEPIGVGTGATPTPGGLYYTTELLIPPPGNDAYGPYAYGLSGYSEVLYSFGGGDGQLGIHGTNDPSSIGRDASNGCIRLSNEAITRLATTLPIGVPVEIRA
jgi:lipoprotein-anchoring transpeptidase ErfK/SrfK